MALVVALVEKDRFVTRQVALGCDESVSNNLRTGRRLERVGVAPNRDGTVISNDRGS